MAVTVEIKTGSRTVISYLLSPLMRYKQEGLRDWKFRLAQCWRAAAPRVPIARYRMNRAHLLLIAALCVLAPGGVRHG
jgi:hypothetical protein